MKSNNPQHDTKMTFLLVISFVLGFVSLLSLIFVLKVKKEGNYMFARNDMNIQLSEETEKVIEDKTNEVTKDSELNIDTAIYEMDKINLDSVINNYTDDILEEGL